MEELISRTFHYRLVGVMTKQSYYEVKEGPERQLNFDKQDDEKDLQCKFLNITFYEVGHLR